MNNHSIFFDFDGTLVDSLPAMRRVYTSFISDYGISASEAEFQCINGPSLPEIVRYLKHKHGLVMDETVLLNRYKMLRSDAYRTQVEPYPGADEVLRVLSSAGNRMFLVTSSESKPVGAFLKRHGWEHFFQGMVCGEHVLHAKPAPDIYRLAMVRAGAKQEHSIAVEDSFNGVCSAAGSGLRVIGICFENSMEELKRAGAFQTVQSLYELPGVLEEL